MPPPPPYDGCHLIADLHGAKRLDDLAFVEEVLRAAAEAAEATLLNVTLHHFGPGLGVTGVALLAESHISIHPWPEHGYAALDMFLCGRSDTISRALALVCAMFEAERVTETRHRRGYGAVAG
jgi:S-adenosylmethionine decarboxylase